MGALRTLRHWAWLSADRAAGRARVLLAINLVLAAAGVAAARRTDMPPVSVDFVSFYAAGALARAGAPAAAYDRAAHAREETSVIGAGRPYQFFFYPPVYLPLCAGLAALPYPAAFAAFEGVTGAAFLLVARAIAGPAARAAWLWPVLAFPAVFWTVGLGQNAFLTAALLGGATLLADRRPVLAGMLMGALCYKPHLALLIPVALVAGGRWRSFIAAGSTAAGLVAVSWLLYGDGTWQAYIGSFLASGGTYGSGRVSFAGMVSPFGAARLAGLPLHAALAVQGAFTLIAALTVAWIWRTSRSPAVRAAALLSGTMLSLPVLLLYDQLITLLAITWLAREGFLPWEKLTLAAAYLLPMLTLPLAALLDLPIAPLPAVLVLGVCVVRLRCGKTAPCSPSRPNALT